MALGKGINWNGKYFVIPQAASRVDSSGLSRVQLGSSGRLCIMGEMVGLLEPKVTKKITNPSLGLNLVHPNSDEVRRAIELVFNPSPGSAPGASEVYLLPVNPAVQGTLTINDASAAGSLVLTSYLYGLIANQIKVKVEAGTTTGKKISVVYQDESESWDNIERESFDIQYTGAGSAATMTIDVDAGWLATSVTGAPADDLLLSFATYPTIQSLVDAIEATGVYTVNAITDAAKTELASQLDKVTAVDVKTAAVTVNSDLQAIIDQINTFSGYISAERAVAADLPPDNQDWTYLASGANGTPDADDWQEAFDHLKTLDMDLIVPLTSDASIHAKLDAHLVYMSGPNGKSERRGFIGGALASWNSEAARTSAIDAIKAAAKLINSDRVVQVGLGSYHFNDDGDSTLYASYITAAMYAGIAAGGGPVYPLTRKYLRTQGLEVDLRTGEIEDLIEAGVAVPIPDRVQGAGYVVSRQVTTWGQDVDDYRVEFSVGRGADYIAREVRRRHELIIGQPGTEGIDQTIINITNAVLEAAKTDGYIRNYDPTATQLRVDGTVRYIDYSAQPILPINWIFSTYHLLPTKITIQLT